MLAPPHPEQEARLRTLRSYEILDTPRESDFDDIVALASRICETPVSVINLIDAERQWFKAEVGLGASETPLETSLCAHVILDDDFVEIPDTLDDPRMRDNPLCTQADGFRFYAGARLVAPDGLPIGTLCVLDNEPRALTDLQREALRVLSDQVMTQLSLRVALRNQKVLRDEADHRVKNSLQALSSLVRIYGRDLEGERSVAAFDAVQRRIDAMASLHHELQSADDEQEVSASSYVRRIVTLLQRSAPPNVAIECDCATFSLDAASASSLGAIISEFVANSIKHAFPDERAGRIVISLRLERGQMVLKCADDGIGSRDAAGGGAVSRPPPSLGSRLVDAAAAQLGGTLETALTKDGSRLLLRFD